MQKLEFVIKNNLGIHARPAGLLVKEAKKFKSRITVSKNDKAAGATKLMAIMGLGVKCNDTITVEIDGEDEESACSALKDFFERNF